MPVAQHTDVVLLVERRVVRFLVGWKDEGRLLVPAEGRADGERPLLAAQLRAPLRRQDGARVDHAQRRREEVGRLHEERPLLGKEQREARVDGELRGVGLDLREIGIERRVERQIGCDAPARRQAPFTRKRSGLKRCALDFLPPGPATGRERWIELEVAPGRDAVEPGHLRLLAEETVTVPVDRPQADLVSEIARVVAHDGEPPGQVLVRPGEAQRGERDCHLDVVSLQRESPGRQPDRVPGHVLVLIAAVADIIARRVHLDSERIHEQPEPAALVVERVQEQRHPIVVSRLVAVGEMRANLGRIRIIGPECRVQASTVVDQKHFGSHRRGDVLSGFDLVRQVEPEGALPGVFVDHAIDPDGGCRARDGVDRRRPGQCRGGRRLQHTRWRRVLRQGDSRQEGRDGRKDDPQDQSDSGWKEAH